jgi:pSer/pThr/pTyr-binding forkhead associated (FHA) protein
MTLIDAASPVPVTLTGRAPGPTMGFSGKGREALNTFKKDTPPGSQPDEAEQKQADPETPAKGTRFMPNISSEITLPPRSSRLRDGLEGAKSVRIAIEASPKNEPPRPPVFMEGDELVVGRTEGDVLVDDRMISKKHAVIEWKDSTLPVLRDLGSLNGTFLNGEKIDRQVIVTDGDEIRVGSCHLRVRIHWQ